ncbi:hypothetical protein JB92DRAFT_2830113 [Gautieria morchelliformis]|nr:hypothetical protein JB92DRAFT_2830113 [Gautieria morchelliformis]
MSCKRGTRMGSASSENIGMVKGMMRAAGTSGWSSAGGAVGLEVAACEKYVKKSPAVTQDARRGDLGVGKASGDHEGRVWMPPLERAGRRMSESRGDVDDGGNCVMWHITHSVENVTGRSGQLEKVWLKDAECAEVDVPAVSDVAVVELKMMSKFSVAGDEELVVGLGKQRARGRLDSCMANVYGA